MEKNENLVFWNQIKIKYKLRRKKKDCEKNISGDFLWNR